MGEHRAERSVFHLDCSELTPGCGYRCGECMSEMREVFGKMPGVIRLVTEGKGEKTLLVVEHDAAEISAQQLLDVFKSLPSRSEGFFKPRLVGRRDPG